MSVREKVFTLAALLVLAAFQSSAADELRLSDGDMITGKFITLFEDDKFADLNLRSTASTGVGHQFFESETLNLSVAAGPAWVNEDFNEASDDDYSAGQWRVNYDQYLFGKFVQLESEHNIFATNYFMYDPAAMR